MDQSDRRSNPRIRCVDESESSADDSVELASSNDGKVHAMANAMESDVSNKQYIVRMAEAFRDEGVWIASAPTRPGRRACYGFFAPRVLRRTGGLGVGIDVNSATHPCHTVDPLTLQLGREPSSIRRQAASALLPWSDRT
jgi:hypothetical protein